MKMLVYHFQSSGFATTCNCFHQTSLFAQLLASHPFSQHYPKTEDPHIHVMTRQYALHALAAARQDTAGTINSGCWSQQSRNQSRVDGRTLRLVYIFQKVFRAVGPGQNKVAGKEWWPWRSVGLLCTLQAARRRMSRGPGINGGIPRPVYYNRL